MQNNPIAYQVRKVGRADRNLAVDCYYIASETLGDADCFIESIPYDVNVLQRPMFVAEKKSNGYLVGFVLGKMLDQKTAEIASLYVTSRARRNGIGATLLSQMEDYLRARGVIQVQLTSRPMAVHFYTERGYVRRKVGSHYLQKTL